MFAVLMLIAVLCIVLMHLVNVESGIKTKKVEEICSTKGCSSTAQYEWHGGVKLCYTCDIERMEK